MPNIASRPSCEPGDARSHRRGFHRARTLLALLAICAGALVGETAPPAGMPAADWSAIRAEYERHRHAAVADPGGYEARNPGQQWMTKFDQRGFTVQPDDGAWSWGLELTSWGSAGRMQESRPAAPAADANRVRYERGGGLEEWFVNDGRGLEQGFTVRERPEGEAELRLELAVRGGLEPRAEADGVRFVDRSGGAVVRYTGLKAWDADGRVLPARFEVMAARVRMAVDARNARYPVTVDPIAQQAYLKASNTDASDWFGSSVAISGDTVVVGALGEDSNATGINGNQADNSASNAGAAYVFVRNGGTWSQQAYLKASNTGAGDQFGRSVAISGDTVVVGAFLEDSNATGINGNQADNSAFQAGAAYVFVRNGGTWSQQAYLKASNTGAGDSFGSSVAISGDTVVAGAYTEASNATGINRNQADKLGLPGWAAYVFVRNGGTWSQQAYLKASNTGASDWFGSSVAISGDAVVAGAFLEDSNATGINGNQADNSASQAGAAYVFVRNGGTWSQQAYLKTSNTGGLDQFGYSVAISGDTMVAGARSEASNATGINGNQADNSASQAGAAYVFVRNGGTWSQQAYLKASNTGAGDSFGSSVAISADTVVVGAYTEASNATGINGNQADNSASQAGAAYVFVRNGGTWSQQAYLKASNTGADDFFGYSVAISGDTAVAGAVQEASNATGINGNQADNSASGAGAAYVFSGIPIPTPLSVSCDSYNGPTMVGVT
ncbi:MAG: FG-GAP repeat protein [Bryobacteraceae bacterium]